ncbi:N-acetylmuramoyl-L-alanine amidase [Pontibacillus yanchengensis]|uniref:N-acetylmuramoyl-L-alanine amidase n=1 Tax=Pontibacillus yanchengensis TaxID=462910 RepID=UPI00301C3E67
MDPSHGCSDPGVSYKGFLKKNYNLTIALKVHIYLLNHSMTRSSDQTISLTERTNMANSMNADYFLSIHNNASDGRGFESHIYNDQVSKQTREAQKK